MYIKLQLFPFPCEEIIKTGIIIHIIMYNNTSQPDFIIKYPAIKHKILR